jgi:transposase
MKRSSHISSTNDCQQQLAEAQQLIAMLQQTVMSQQEALQAAHEQHHQDETTIAGLNNTVATLQTEKALDKQTIASLAKQNEQQEVIIHKQEAVIAEQVKRLQKSKSDQFDYKLLRYQWMQLRKMIYGRKSEKRFITVEDTATKPSTQGRLFDVPADHQGTVKLCDAKKIKERMVVVVNNKSAAAPHPGRHELPEHLERRIVKIQQQIPEGAVKVGVERTERLACSMMEVWVHVEERDIYMIKTDAKGSHKQLIAPLAPHPIPKCKADVSLLVLLLIEKYLYHLPLWRIRQRFRQYGVDLKYSTLTHWVSSSIDVLRPLWELAWKDLRASGYIHFDETQYKVLDMSKAKGKRSHNGYLWVAGNPIQGSVCFTYKKGRGKAEIRDILGGFKGYLHTDAYGGYDEYGKQPGVTHLLCMDHARRYFVTARDNDVARSNYAVDTFFAPLYQIERACKEQQLSYDEITAVRQEQSVPVLNALQDWLTQEITQVIEGTPIYTAMAYTLKRMKHLTEYTKDGMLAMSTMFIEQAIRPSKIGLKNYLFAGSHEHGQRAAIIYSLLQTCKLHQINPTEYLQDVLLRINDHKQNKLAELLPQNWKPIYSNRRLVTATQSA